MLRVVLVFIGQRVIQSESNFKYFNTKGDKLEDESSLLDFNLFPFNDESEEAVLRLVSFLIQKL